jgi:protoporphyrinogen oxidase
MYPPKLEEVVRGALVPVHEGDFHYVSTCRYPRRGGYQAFMRGLLREELLQLGRRVVRVDLRARELHFEDGAVAPWSRLISTMPLPDLIAAIDKAQVPANVRTAVGKLLWTSLVLVDVAVERPDLLDHHWFYVYDDDIAIVRGHFPHRLAPSNAPEGCGSIQLEVYHSVHRRLPCSVDNLAQRVVEELVRLRILAKQSEVLWARARPVSYANVVFNRYRARALAIILPWVEQQGILLAGRYGEWGYHWTDDATVSGWTAADRILSS